MKKNAFLLFITGLAAALSLAEAEKPSSYPPMTIAEAVKQPDETRMSIEGTFIRQHRGEEDEFVFQDSAGEEIIVYDRKEGQNIRIGVPVIAMGEIDRGILGNEFNLHRVDYSSESTPVKQMPPAEAKEESEFSSRDGILIHLSSGPDDPARVAMAMALASAYAGENPVLIYADLEAVALFTEQFQDVAPEGYLSFQESLLSLLEKGVLIRVCPTCLNAGGLSTTDIREGVRLADKREFLTFAGGRILSFDY